MDIGGALAEARSEAGLTVTQVSERTRIRETIIRDIEHDDYAACGGDFYARGHIRAIARVVGTDPVPLIEEYDAAHLPPADAAEQPGSGRRGPSHSGPSHSGPSHSGASDTAPSATRRSRIDPDADTDPDLLADEPLEFGLPGALWPKLRQSAAHQAGRFVAAVKARLGGPPGTHDAEVIRPAALSGITAAQAFGPRLPLDFERRRPWRVRTGLVALLAVAIVGTLVYLLLSPGSSHGGAPTTPPRHHSAGAATHHVGAAAHHAGTAAHRADATASPGATTKSAVTFPLIVTSAAAFGPGGTSQGDDPQGAALAIDANAGTAWHTDWYTTADLGGLQAGTGLLLDLRESATISSATIALGATPGGTIELRAGDAPTLAGLPVLARSTNPGGTLTMRLSAPVRARYVLIWFTSLPPDNVGTYEGSIYDVRLSGTV